MQNRQHLVLVGPMGAGKSTLGRALAARLQRPFVDVDARIEAEAGCSIAALFEAEGETGFRAREARVLSLVLGEPAAVIATGGGAVLAQANCAAMRAAGIVVYLQVDAATQLARLQDDSTRPLLQAGDRAPRLAQLQAQREPLYRAAAHLLFDAANLAPEAAAAALAGRLDDFGATTGMNTPLQTLTVAAAAPYPIHIGAGLLDHGDLLAQPLRGRHALLVSDANVAPLYADRVEAALRDARPDLHIARQVIRAGEAEKTLANFAGVIDALAVLGATRDACVYALGGGVVGDLAGFAAACWMRGIDIVQLPTTLLSMVDSSVGGKTAVDIPQGKNLVGAFHVPRAVLADTASLRTLPPRELRAGLAEVIKYGAIMDAGFLTWLDARHAALLAGDDAALAEAIARSCAHKAAITARDPLEQGERALLNFGHTFGHAIEAEQGYADGLNHGEAVAVGMLLAARLSAALGLASWADAEALRALLLRFGLPVDVPAGLAPEALLARMRLDKKVQASGLRFILWDGPGAARIVADVDEAAVLAVLRDAG
jgi:3-dehydroquinate synthase